MTYAAPPACDEGRGAALAASLLALGAVSACTGSSGGSTASGGASSPSTTGTAVAPVPSASAIKNQPAARKDVTSAGCVATTSGWKASGSVANPGAKSATYTIVMSFTTKQSTVLARGTTT